MHLYLALSDSSWYDDDVYIRSDILARGYFELSVLQESDHRLYYCQPSFMYIRSELLPFRFQQPLVYYTRTHGYTITIKSRLIAIV